MDPYVVEYRAEWPADFAEEERAIIDVLGPLGSGRVEHIGSTAIPGMPAKPIIDMMAAVADLEAGEQAAPLLVALGYERHPHRIDAVLYVKGDTHHLHLTPTSSALWRERLTFRDAIRGSAELHAEYRALKYRLLARNDGAGYSGADKRDFVRRVLATAGTELTDGLHVDHELRTRSTDRGAAGSRG